MRKRTGGKEGDARFEALYRKHYPRVYRYFARYGVADAEAHDLSQDTFKRILEAFDDYRGEAEWSFIEKTARNVLLNWVRSRNTVKRNMKLVELDDPQCEHDPPAPDGPDLATRQEAESRRTRLREAIARLPQGQRECMQLWLTELKYHAIARVMGITVDAVKSRIRDAKRALRDELGEALPEDEE
jgi:RNA polymerase sigma-70 factor (ECF subfamily)